MQSLRAVIFYLVYSLTLITYAFPCLIIGPFLPWRKRYDFFVLWGVFVQWWLRVTCGVRYEIVGQENVPTGPFIIISNHQSPWETFFLYDYFRPVCAILKKELLSIPFFGWGLRMLHPIAIDRSKRSAARKLVLLQGKARLDSGISVLIFPEGTRVDPGQRKRFSPGGAELAIATGATILPMAHNAGLFWPAKKLAKRPGTIKVVIGQPVSAVGRETRSLSEEVQNWIHTTLDSLEAEGHSTNQG